MKNDRAMIALWIFAFGLGLLGLACGSGNQNQANTNTANTNTASTTTTTGTPDPDPCGKSTIGLRKDAVEAYLRFWITDDKELKNTTRFDVTILYNNYLQVRIEGQADGDDELNDLYKILKPTMQKYCVMSVLFVPMGTLPPNGPYVPGDYEWTACEYPKRPCPTGECGDCPRGGPAGTPSVNANTTANSNTGANTSSTGSNANRTSNSNSNKPY